MAVAAAMVAAVVASAEMEVEEAAVQAFQNRITSAKRTAR